MLAVLVSHAFVSVFSFLMLSSLLNRVSDQAARKEELHNCKVMAVHLNCALMCTVMEASS